MHMIKVLNELGKEHDRRLAWRKGSVQSTAQLGQLANLGTGRTVEQSTGLQGGLSM